VHLLVLVAGCVAAFALALAAARLSGKGTRQARVALRFATLAIAPFSAIALAAFVFLMVGRDCFSHSEPWDQWASLLVSSGILVLAGVSASGAARRHLELGRLMRVLAGDGPEGGGEAAACPGAPPASHAGIPIRIVPYGRPLALLLGWFRPQIFLSSWYLETLDAAELTAVVAHEEAHALGGDGPLLWAAAVFAHCLPIGPLLAVHRDLLLDIEEGADERAARQAGPLPLASVLAKTMLAEPRTATLAGVTALGAEEFLLRRRICRLLASTGRTRVPNEPAGSRQAWLACGLAGIAILLAMGVAPYWLMVADHDQLCDITSLLHAN
jgi:hypothetical protein